MRSLNLTAPDEALCADAAVAAKAFSKLGSGGRGAQTRRVSLEARDQQQKIRAEVPMAIFDLFINILEELAEGHAVTLVPGGKELTTQQAADLLNVSRPYLIQLLEEGRIPFRRVGTRRRVKFEDLITFRNRDDARRKQVADALTKEAEDLDLEY